MTPRLEQKKHFRICKLTRNNALRHLLGCYTCVFVCPLTASDRGHKQRVEALLLKWIILIEEEWLLKFTCQSCLKYYSHGLNFKCGLSWERHFSQRLHLSSCRKTSSILKTIPTVEGRKDERKSKESSLFHLYLNSILVRVLHLFYSLWRSAWISLSCKV